MSESTTKKENKKTEEEVKEAVKKEVPLKGEKGKSGGFWAGIKKSLSRLFTRGGEAKKENG